MIFGLKDHRSIIYQPSSNHKFTENGNQLINVVEPITKNSSNQRKERPFKEKKKARNQQTDDEVVIVIFNAEIHFDSTRTLANFSMPFLSTHGFEL